MEKQPIHQNQKDEPEKAVDFAKILAIVKKNWMILKSDRGRLFPMLLFPLVMIIIYGSTAGVSTRFIPTAIADYDQTPQSHAVTEAFSATQSLTIASRMASQEQGKRALEEGKVKMLIVIPAGFGNEVEGGKNPKVSIMIDESDTTVSQVAKAVAQGVLAQASSRFRQQKIEQLRMMIAAAQEALQKALSVTSSSTFYLSQPAMDSHASARMRDAQGINSAAAASLESASLALINTVGFPIDPNEVFFTGSPTSSSQAGFSLLLSSANAQQTALAQASYYRALEAQLGKVSSDASSIYADYQSSRALNAKAAGDLANAGAQVRSAQANLNAANSQSNSISTAITANYIEPFGFGRRGLDFLIGNILALVIFQGAAAGLGRAIAGEKQNGALTRVFLTPTSNTTIIIGTQLFYFAIEALRSSLLILFAVLVFGVSIKGNVLDVFAIIALYSIGATGVGMILSVLSRTQEQYQAISIVVILPTIFLGGVFFPVQTLPSYLQVFASVLPMAYAGSALNAVMVKGFGLAQVVPQLAYLAVFAGAMLAITLVWFKRDIA